MNESSSNKSNASNKSMSSNSSYNSSKDTNQQPPEPKSKVKIDDKMTVENIDSERHKTDEIEITESPGKAGGTPDSQATECANNANRTRVTPTRPTAMKQLQLPIEIRRNNRVIYSLRLKVTKTTDPLKTMQHALSK